ncbi:MAG: Flp pilus assembly protein CpaB [Bacillota bacterium]
MDKGKILRLVLIPIVAGLVVTLLAQRMIASAERADATPKVEMVSVVTVATKEPIPARTKLSESQFALKQIPKELATGNEVSALKDVAEKIGIVELHPGEVLLKSRIVAEGQGALPYRIPEGKRAVTIRMDELNGVAGHPQPGDLVDLILFLPEKKVEEPVKFTYPASSRILYEAVQVLEKGPVEELKQASPAQQPGDKKLTSITLALTPQQAAEVALAEQVGHIKMILRPALKQPDVGNYQTDEGKYRNNPLILDPNTLKPISR